MKKMRRRYLEGVGCLLVAVGAALLLTEPGMRWTARALEGGRELAVAVGLLEEPEAPPPSESEEEEQDDRMMGDGEEYFILSLFSSLQLHLFLSFTSKKFGDPKLARSLERRWKLFLFELGNEKIANFLSSYL